MKKSTNPDHFKGTSTYVVDPELAKVVNISVALEMPLLLKGEPGTGKTLLAHALAENLGMELIVLNVKSSMKAVDALYHYDTLTRLNDSRFGDSGRDVSNIKNYMRMGKIGQAFVAEERAVLLIDEIDKADSDFQDDLLDVLDQMTFDIVEIDETVKAVHRPVVIIPIELPRDYPCKGIAAVDDPLSPRSSFLRRFASMADIEQKRFRPIRVRHDVLKCAFNRMIGSDHQARGVMGRFAVVDLR